MNSTTSIFVLNSRLSCPHSQWLKVAGLMVLVTAILASPLEADVSLHLIPPMWQFSPPTKAQGVAKNVRDQLLQQLVKNDEEFAKRLGFNSAGEVITPPLDVGPPFAVFRVGLKRVQDFHPGQNPIELLLDEANWHRPSGSIFAPVRFLFPLTVGGTVRSSVWVSLPLTNNNWDVQQIGSPKLIKQLTKHGSGPRYFVVWIPALNRYYLGKVDAAGFEMTVIFNKDPIGFNEGDKRPAKEVFKRLKNEAIKIDMTDPKAPPR